MNAEYKIGLGMYTVHREIQKDLKAVCGRLAQMGYQGLEFYGEPKEFPVNRVRSALEYSGLEITGWHMEWKNLQKDTIDQTIEYLLETGCPAAVVPCLGGRWNVGHDSKEEGRDRWMYYIERLNLIHERLSEEGLRMGYHNHEHEFLLKYDGKTVFDLLFENLPQEVVMELDSGNCIEGGEDPVRILNQYRDRPVFLHLKPYSKKREFEVVLGEEDDANDWKTMLNQPGTAIEWLLVESENSSLPEMENAKRCLQNLTCILQKKES